MAIKPDPRRPVYLAGLTTKQGAVGFPLGDSGDKLVGVEWRVGRGGVSLVGLNPTDPALATWPGLNTFVRRVVLRRPDEPPARPAATNVRGPAPPGPSFPGPS